MDNFKAGAFYLDALTLVNQDGESVDITKLCTNFRLYESIYKKFVTGDVSIMDGLNLIKNFKFSGQEYVRVSMKQTEGVGDTSEREFSIDKTFRVYKVKNVNRPTQDIQTYLMKLCDPRMFFVRRKRVSKVLRGSYDQMLQNMLIDEANIQPEEFDHWEKTLPENQQFICPNWNVATFIDYVVNNSNKSPNPSYRNGMFFYQTLNGGFRFKSIDEMFESEFPMVFSNRPVSGTLDTAETDINAKSGLNAQILNYHKPHIFDTLRGTVTGAYASSMKVYDPVRKVEEDIYYDMEETFDRGKHLSGFPMILTDGKKEFLEKTLTTGEVIEKTTSPVVTEVDVDLAPNKVSDGVVLYDYTTLHAYDNADDISTQENFEGYKTKDNGRLERRALLEILQQHKIIVTIPLRTDLSVGTIVELEITEPETGNQNDDKANDNRYLITDIAISADPTEFAGTMVLECVKESFAIDLRDIRPQENMEGPEEV